MRAPWHPLRHRAGILPRGRQDDRTTPLRDATEALLPASTTPDVGSARRGLAARSSAPDGRGLSAAVTESRCMLAVSAPAMVTSVVEDQAAEVGVLRSILHGR